jgi:hypothetical protein
MFTNLGYPLSRTINPQPTEYTIRIEAARVFNRLYTRGQFGQLWAKLLGRKNNLKPTLSLPVDSHHKSSRIVSIQIRNIKGSLGRSEYFDANFNPLQEDSRSRWSDVYTAFRMSIPLPPVELLQSGEDYIVQDGHHRISVAKALGQEAIDARIVN